MKRLTTKYLESDNYFADEISEDATEEERNKYHYSIIVKLGQYEDIDDELGIDFITLFKALKNGGVYVKNGFTEDIPIKMHSFQICGDDNGITIWSQVKLNAKDYGKTWALTKEELL